MSLPADTTEPPQWFKDFPEPIQSAWVAAGLCPKSWAPSGFSYAPQWANDWGETGKIEWAAPAGLAPWYSMSMITRAYREGWIPGAPELWTYQGRVQQAELTSGSYAVAAGLSGFGPTKTYDQMQSLLWGARAAQYQFQQGFGPAAEAYSALRLYSFVNPDFSPIRMFGFPFYNAAQQIGVGAEMTPYMRQAASLYPSLTQQKIQTQTGFWPGQYQETGAQLLSNFGEWTVAQSLTWKLLRGTSFRETAGVSLVQTGLAMMTPPLSTMAVRSMWGQPLFYNAKEEQEAIQQIGTGGAFMVGGAVAASRWGWMNNTAQYQYEANMFRALKDGFGGDGLDLNGELARSFGYGGLPDLYTTRFATLNGLPAVEENALRFAAPDILGAAPEAGYYGITGPGTFPKLDAWERLALLPESEQGAILQQMYETGNPMSAYIRNIAPEFQVPELFLGESGTQLGKFGTGNLFPESPVSLSYSEQVLGSMNAGPKWAWPSMRSPFVSGMRAIGSIVGGIGGFFAGGYLGEKGFQAAGWNPDYGRIIGEYGGLFGGSILGSKVMSVLGEKLVERGLEGPGLARTLSAFAENIAGPVSTMAGILGPIAAIATLEQTYADLIYPTTKSYLTYEMQQKYSLTQRAQMLSAGYNMPGGWAGIPMGETLKESLAATTGLVNYLPNLPRDISLRYIAERNPDIMPFLSPGDANAARSASYLSSPLGNLDALPTGILDRYIAVRNPDVVNYLTSKQWQNYYTRHPELEPIPFSAAEISQMPDSIQARYLAEKNPNYLSYYYGPGGPSEQNYLAGYWGRESAYTEIVDTGITQPNPYRYGSAEYQSWENANPLATRPTQLIQEKIPWKYYSALATGQPEGFWGPDLSAERVYPVGSSAWASQVNENMRRAGWWLSRGEPSPGTQAWADWVRNNQSDKPTSVQLIWTPKYTGSGYRSSDVPQREGGAGENWAPGLLEQIGMNQRQTDKGLWTGGSSGSGYLAGYGPAPYVSQPESMVDQQTYFQNTIAGRNYLYYPSTFEWANRLGYGANFPKSAQGRYGLWWGGYYNEGKDPWEMEKGEYAITAGAPSVEDMSDTVAATMIGDEVMWLAENSDLPDGVGAAFYRIQRETS